MGRLQHTEGLTADQREMLKLVKEFVDEQIIPVATELEHKDEYPSEIVEGMKEMGVFGLMIPEEYGGLGESLLTYALVVEEIARGWMSVSGIINTHFIVAYMLIQHGTPEQKAHYLPKMATGEMAGFMGEDADDLVRCIGLAQRAVVDENPAAVGDERVEGRIVDDDDLDILLLKARGPQDRLPRCSAA